MKKSALVSSLGLMPVAVFLVAACADSGPPLGQKIATRECVACHANLITCTKLGNDDAYWEKTVQRMVEKDMDISQEEQEAVTTYFQELEPGASPICD